MNFGDRLRRFRENKDITQQQMAERRLIEIDDVLQKEYNKGLRATLDSIVVFFGGITTSLIGFLLGFAADQMVEEKLELLGHLARTGVLPEDAALEDILDLTVEDILRRRLQTIVFQKGLARTAKEARMFVVHGHITLNGKKINSPSYVVLRGQEDEIGFYRSSPVAKQIEEYNKNKDNKANTEE